MLKNYLITGFRSLRRNKTFTILNIVGLAIGIAAGMLILEYVADESDYDKFHVDKDRLVRVDHRFLKDGKLDFESARTFPRVGPAMMTDFPEVENYCRIVPQYRGGIVKSGEQSFREENLWYADSSMFTMFSFPWVDGDKATALDEIHTAAVEEVTARKYFGNENPIGKRITVGTINGEAEYEIRGVFRCPTNSHIKMTFVFSYPTLISLWGKEAHDFWGWYDFHTYLLLRPDADRLSMESRLPAFVDRNGGTRLGSKRVELSLRPLTDIHLNSHLMMEASVNGSAGMVSFLMILGIAILLIAWTNYINLSTARAMERAREVGIRKVSGSSRTQLAVQFIMEAFIINGGAVLIGLVLIALFLPLFNELTGKTFDFEILTSPDFMIKLVTLFAAGSIISGAYPAFVLSSYQPLKVLKGTLRYSGQGLIFRKVLVVAQFAASVVLIAGTMIVYRQIGHLRNIDLGFDIGNSLVVRTPDVITDQRAYARSMEAYRDEVLMSHAVTSGTLTSEIPGKQVGWYGSAKRIGLDQEAPASIVYLTTMDPDYFNTYHIDLIAGRSYPKGQSEDSLNVVLNKKATQILGFESPEEAVQSKILLRGDSLTIIGVVEDYHHESPKEDYRPSAYLLTREDGAYFSFRIEGRSEEEVVALARETYAQIFPGAPFDYFFLNDLYQQQYAEDEKFLGTFTLFATMAIVIASLGLFGLSAYTIVQRTKEVGIRKVLGSSNRQVFVLFVRDFSLLILVANVLAIPMVWIIMREWLSGFAERTSIGGGVFVTTFMLTSMLAVGTISYHALRSARMNPAEALKNE